MDKNTLLFICNFLVTYNMLGTCFAKRNGTWHVNCEENGYDKPTTIIYVFSLLVRWIWFGWACGRHISIFLPCWQPQTGWTSRYKRVARQKIRIIWVGWFRLFMWAVVVGRWRDLEKMGRFVGEVRWSLCIGIT